MKDEREIGMFESDGDVFEAREKWHRAVEEYKKAFPQAEEPWWVDDPLVILQQVAKGRPFDGPGDCRPVWNGVN